LAPNRALPYVGSSAFAHKGGIHVSAVQRHPETYEHVRPELVGNHQRVLVSEQAGRSNLVHKAREMGLELDAVAGSEALAGVLAQVKDLEANGYQFEGAEASFALMLRRALGKTRAHFVLAGFRVINEKRGDGEAYCEATIKVVVGGQEAHTAAEGDGPVNALDNALRKALIKFYPGLKQLALTDYKVRVLNEKEGTAARVRVLMEFADGSASWGTVGCSTNIVEASWQALVDGFDYFLMRRGRRK
jgi:2-isopropylmalate synthase